MCVQLGIDTYLRTKHKFQHGIQPLEELARDFDAERGHHRRALELQVGKDVLALPHRCFCLAQLRGANRARAVSLSVCREKHKKCMQTSK